MLTLRDIVAIAAVVAIVLWFFRRKKAGCGCAHPKPAAAAPAKRCGLIPCGGGK